MEIIKASKLKAIRDKDGLIAKKLSENPNFEIVHLTIEPNSYLKPHKVPFPVQFYIVEGTATFLLDGEEYKITENYVLNCDLESEHGIMNKADTELIILVIKHINHKERI